MDDNLLNKKRNLINSLLDYIEDNYNNPMLYIEITPGIGKLYNTLYSLNKRYNDNIILSQFDLIRKNMSKAKLANKKKYLALLTKLQKLEYEQVAEEKLEKKKYIKLSQ